MTLSQLSPKRNTPASAGRTLLPDGIGDALAEHPRVGGKDEHPDMTITRAHGTPPRRREGRGQDQRGPAQDRNTPASAGRTQAERLRRPRAAEHPRVGGKDPVPGASPALPSGTPPRRREGRHPRVDDRPVGRNTPASAGRTQPVQPERVDVAEHPRVGGKDMVAEQTGQSQIGTPPRRREGPASGLAVDLLCRNTPASAGRTWTRSTGARSMAEHPRVGGKDTRREAVWGSCDGTPPRRREGRPPPLPRHRVRRNTPASAGRTPRPLCPDGLLTEHPRVGGKDPLSPR